MSAPHTPEQTPAAAADESARRSPVAPPRDFADLAKRISGRTTDLFAMALVVVLLLSLGTRVMHWWRAEPPTVAGELADTPMSIWDDPANLDVQLDAGPWKLTRSTVRGTVDEVTGAALDQARRTLEASPSTDLPPPDAAELQWLRQLRDWPPQSTTEHGETFMLGGPWPWIVATRSTLIDSAESRAATHAVDSRRVLCWTFALPSAQQNWTLYTAVRANQAAHVTSSQDIVIPSGARRLLTAHSSRGGITSFRGDGPLHAVQDDWDRQLVAAGWRPVDAWSGDNQIRRATFTNLTGDSAKRLEAALTQDANGTISGIADWRQQ